jgi:hypothetical protein
MLSNLNLMHERDMVERFLLITGGIAIIIVLLILSPPRALKCPEPSPRSVEALFAPCLRDSSRLLSR